MDAGFAPQPLQISNLSHDISENIKYCINTFSGKGTSAIGSINDGFTTVSQPQTAGPSKHVKDLIDAHQEEMSQWILPEDFIVWGGNFFSLLSFGSKKGMFLSHHLVSINTVCWHRKDG